jgi:hypothetical protein
MTPGLGAEDARAGDAGPVVVGSASRDLAAADPRGWRLGGAVTYAGLALARLGLRPRILLGADASALAASELDLIRDAGADLRLVRLARSPVFDNREVGGVRAQHCLEPGSPAGLRVAGGVADRDRLGLGPVAGSCPDEWGACLQAAHVALGWQGSSQSPARRARCSACAWPSPLLARADLPS